MVSNSQIKAARMLLGWTQADLSKRSRVSLPRIVAIEQGKDHLQSTAAAIITAFVRAGAQFTASGVGIQKPQAEDFIAGPGSPDAETIRAARTILAAAAKAKSPRGALG